MARESVSFSDQVRAEARRLGFDAVGIARASADLGFDFQRYASFVRGGMHGEMDWLARNQEARSRVDGDEILSGARSVVCVARRYSPATSSPPPSSPPPSNPAHDDGIAHAIARYARGRDYHGFLRRRIRRLASFLRSLGTAERPVRARPICDDAPLLERAWAVRAGLGFIGKNGMLIVPGLGSMVLLGEVVTTLELEAAPWPQPEGFERCGACTRCLDACPTGAFVAPFVLDARRCVSYLTIEHRSAIDPQLREGVGTHLFGCDDCQTVCPFNAGSGARRPLGAVEGGPFASLEKWSQLRLEQLLSLDEAAWGTLFQGTPLTRATRAGMARNAALVLGNRGDSRALPALRAAASDHDDEMVREAARWAIARIDAYSACAVPFVPT